MMMLADGEDDGNKNSPEEEDVSVIKAEASEENKVFMLVASFSAV